MKGLLTALLVSALVIGCGGKGGGGDEDAQDTIEDTTDTAGDIGDDTPTETTDTAEDTPTDEVTGPEVECTSAGDCDDSDPCTSDTCSDAGVCEHVAVDADEDGYPAEEVSGTACGGTDCDDTDDEVYPGAAEICDTIDQDCDDDILDAEGADDDTDTYLDEACGGDDCNDLEYSIYPGATEVCLDGIDQDCDGLIDGPTPILSDVRITNVPERSDFPIIAWTGSEFGVAWQDQRVGHEEIYFARITSDGTKIGSETRITFYSTDSEVPRSLAWTGSEFGIVWNPGDSVILLARIDASGTKIGTDEPISVGTSYDRWSPTLVWTGSQFGIAWHDGDDIYFSLASDTGIKIGTDMRITDDPSTSQDPSLVWTGSEYGVSWWDRRDGNEEIYFARISDSGSKVGVDMRITNDTNLSMWPSLVWTGSEYGVAWDDNRGGRNEVYFARISESGSKIGSDVQASIGAGTTRHIQLTWTGSEFFAWWLDARTGDIEIYSAIISAAGVKVGSDLRVTNDTIFQQFQYVVWTGSEFGATWFDSRHGPFEIFFNRIGLCD